MTRRTGYRLSEMTISLASVFLLLVPAVFSQTLEQEIHSAGNRFPINRPVSLSVSPSGGSFAVADQFGNSFYVFDTKGSLLWSVGDKISLPRPAAVCLVNDDELLFALKDRPVVFRANSRNTQTVDTVADLSTAKPPIQQIDQLLQASDSRYIILDQKLEQIISVDKDWKQPKVLLSQGQGRGKVWAPTGIALDQLGNIVVGDTRTVPMQCISTDGSVLFSAGWNRPGTTRTWEASTVGVDRQGVIWVSDWQNTQWRRFDATGNEIGQTSFGPELLHPVAIAFTPDNQLIVLEERGAILLYSLP